MCVKVSTSSNSTIFLLDFGIVPTVLYFFFLLDYETVPTVFRFFVFASLYNCSDGVIDVFRFYCYLLNLGTVLTVR